MGGVNLTLSTPAGAESKEVVSADFLPNYVSDNANSRIENKFSQVVTNCITEIPQDIKLELTDGVLTLKAGSKLWYPDGLNEDGSKKYNSFICPSDLVLQGAETGLAAAQRIVVIDTETYEWTYRYLSSSVYSGDATPTVSNQYALWYDTSTNLIKRTSDTGVTWTNAKTSFPVCVYTRLEGGVVSAIDQIFNGFGYIGSTIFILPGVKGLIPNGRNRDGSLNNKFFSYNEVKTETAPTDLGIRHILLDNEGVIFSASWDYNLAQNKLVTESQFDYMDAGSIMLDNGVITSFSPKFVMNAVDRNDSTFLSAQSMPSNKYIDLTLGASKSTYTAPANGWFVLNALHGNNTTVEGVSLINMVGGTSAWVDGMINRLFLTISGISMGVFVPVSRGDVVAAIYNFTGNLLAFRFYYAQGET